ncbi:HlyD family secretion protein [Kordiimonas pumila]|uniref:HlyD family secretion protein n=1 Tax=Kordiimonas pumila TaxID=2161677 RepID=A0ABV7D8X0_9PROT|nr:biotin/lipoyl-binding protein [Kordiimonas pumila]
MRSWYVLLVVPFMLLGCDKTEDGVFYGYAEGRFRLIAPEAAGRITEINVQEGQVVEKGQILAMLDNTIELASLAEMKAKARASEARVQDASLGGRAPEIQAAKDLLTQAKASAKAAKDDFDRVKPLVEQNVLPRARLDSAEATMLAANARVAEMRERLAVVELPAREYAIKAATGEAEATNASITAAEIALERRAIKAPAGGVIERLVRRAGEMAGPSQPVVRFLPDGDMVAVLFTEEPHLASFRQGLVLDASCDSCPAGLTATVSYIANRAEFTAPTIFSDKERAKLVYRIEARLSKGAPPTGTPMTFRRRS